MYLQGQHKSPNISTRTTQGRVHTRSKMGAFQKKLTVANALVEGDLQMFTNFDEYMNENDVNRKVVTLVMKHLESLAESFARYYPRKEYPRHGNMWIIYPFALKIQDNNLNMHLKESLVHL
ncbi:uncharacterized protein TNCV_3385491 [Trichonephila clavipes]|uniref:Uncharacterized protein n=1 Tax=Trichonephila clavipes TaxID=2585209 RepID=A0A8X6SUS1_TRICX|nr:uncharacterized protein TNCV_3385491 [Trichonephila clavipes]